jgi:hydroxymethylbilane synthase
MCPGTNVSIISLPSEGDVRGQEPIRDFGDKGVFVARIERALLDGDADIAVHSLKDLPGPPCPGLELFAFLPRTDPRDVLVSASGLKFHELPAGSRIGTSSPRRVVQLTAARNDLAFHDIRGNVDTRLRQLNEGVYDAVVLAAAGVIRLQLADRITEFLDPAVCTPAPGQGIIALQARIGDPVIAPIRSLGEESARRLAIAERALASALDADCATPFGALAVLDGDTMILSAFYDGVNGIRRAVLSGPAAEPTVLAHNVAAKILESELEPSESDLISFSKEGCA